MKLIVLTPTYNRAHLLPRVYESLVQQTKKDFIWLVVDDGSTDGTDKLIESFVAEAKIEIRYVYEENGGKMRAHNAGVRSLSDDLVSPECLLICLDSDDYFTKTAVNDIFETWGKRPKKDGFAGIIAHKGIDESHTLYSAAFPDIDDTTLSGLYRRGFKGETSLAIRTDILMKHLFPEIPGEKYVPEDLVYDEIDKEYLWIIREKIWTICEIVEAGLTDRVDELREKNPTAWYLYYVTRAKSEPFSILKTMYAAH
ncbi:MAG: glycosyltransferase family 2 protein, partial [Lachnospiraceae bacterium]|nr:glycosyltransferase family 2 protein [Lachnospiraceae bacterium]